MACARVVEGLLGQFLFVAFWGRFWVNCLGFVFSRCARGGGGRGATWASDRKSRHPTQDTEWPGRELQHPGLSQSDMAQAEPEGHKQRGDETYMATTMSSLP